MAQLSSPSKYVYGTTRLGDEKIPLADRIKIARAAMDAGVWFHTSHQYGNALQVLRAAFDEDRAHVPHLIYKIGWSSIEEIRGQVQLHLDALKLDHMDMGQLCLGGKMADELRTGGKCYDDFRKLKAEGLVRKLVLEVFPWTSQVPLDALRGGWPNGVVDGYIFYLNPLQRFASNAAWDLIIQQNQPILALRTVGGGSIDRLCEKAWKDYIKQRANEVFPIFQRSGIESWTEFCTRFAFSFPQVKCTIGATSQTGNLEEFLRAARDPKPLAPDIVSEITSLQRRWSDETDVHAEPWSM